MNNKELMNHLVDFATRIFQGTGQVISMWVLVDQDGGQYVYATPFGSDAEKDATSAMIRHMVREKKAVRIGFVTEAWYARVPPGKTDDEVRQMLRPSMQPDKMECIFISVEDQDGQGYTGMMEIKRNEGRGELGEPDVHATGKRGNRGRFAEMFERTVH